MCVRKLSYVFRVGSGASDFVVYRGKRCISKPSWMKG